MKNNEHNSLAEQARQAAQETAEMVQRHPASVALQEHLAAAQLRMAALQVEAAEVHARASASCMGTLEKMIQEMQPVPESELEGGR